MLAQLLGGGKSHQQTIEDDVELYQPAGVGLYRALVRVAAEIMPARVHGRLRRGWKQAGVPTTKSGDGSRPQLASS